MGLLEKCYLVSADFEDWTEEKEKFYKEHTAQPPKAKDCLDPNMLNYPFFREDMTVEEYYKEKEHYFKQRMDDFKLIDINHSESNAK